MIPRLRAVTYNDARHMYWLDGRHVPSVTTILRGGIPKGDALKWWAARVVANAAANHASTVDAVREMGREVYVDALVASVKEATKSAQVKGTDIHALAELVVVGEQVEIAAHGDEVAGYAAWLDASGFVPEHVEAIVASRRYQYAGRFDVMGVMRGERWLLDLKTGGGIYPETPCQLAAYARADFLVLPDDREFAMPDVDRIGVVHITANGSALYDMSPIDAAFDEFLAARVVHLSAGRRKALCDAAPLDLEAVAP